jgi:hypothetical protein
MNVAQDTRKREGGREREREKRKTEREKKRERESVRLERLLDNNDRPI